MQVTLNCDFWIYSWLRFHPSEVPASALLFRTHVNRMKIELPVQDVWHESALRINSNNKTNKTTE